MHFFSIGRIGRAALAVLGVAILAAAGPASAPQPLYGPGERAEYRVRLAGVGVGRGSLEMLTVQNVNGRPAYHARMTVQGGVPGARVNDLYETWIDTAGGYSRRFHQKLQEVRYRRDRTYDFNPERRTWRRDNGDTGTLPTSRPLDDLSFLYHVRTLPLEVGKTYTLRDYFKEDGNPVVLRVVRRETVEVPAGRFRTIVVRPSIRTSGLFSEGGQAEVHFTDDARRVVVLIRSRVPVVGSLTMHLERYQPAR
ncbi:MAG TPA: DUF3108 domain-containing protein [Longimicrobium sp.]|jgi:hypothetical protein